MVYMILAIAVCAIALTLLIYFVIETVPNKMVAFHINAYIIMTLITLLMMFIETN